MKTHKYASVLLASWLMLPYATMHALEVGESISNTATASFQLTPNAPTVTVASNTVNIVKTIRRTDAVLEFLQINGSSANNATFQSECLLANGSIQPVTSITHPIAQIGTMATSTPVPIAPVSSYRANEPIIIQVTDLDQNLNSQVVETVMVTVEGDLGDRENITLYETGPNTGSFRGVVQSTTAPSQPLDCQLSLRTGGSVNASYRDVIDNTDTSVQSVLIDPYGVIYDSISAAPINDAIVTLYFIQPDGTRVPATVFADDGITPWPSTVISGSSVTTVLGTEQFVPGGYRFPLVALGSYVIVVESTKVNSGPSILGAAEAVTVNGQTFTISATGSYEQPFDVILGPPIRIDIPKDSEIAPGNSSDLVVSKVVNVPSASVGDFVKYTITVKNINPLVSKQNVRIVDAMPAGLRYQARTAQLNSVRTSDPTINPSTQQLEFIVPQLAPNSSATLSFVTVLGSDVTPNSRLDNQAWAQVGNDKSNTALAVLQVQDELMQHTNQLLGRITDQGCDKGYRKASSKDLSGIRFFLEDGRYALTDREGKFHFDHVSSASHVVQLDTDSLPTRAKPIVCEHSTLTTNKATSQFVDLNGGGLWRSDFYIQWDDTTAESNTYEVTPNQLNTEYIPSTFAFITPRAAHAEHVAQDVIIAAPTGFQVLLQLNGSPVNPVYLGKRIQNKQNATIYNWIGLPMQGGTNTLTAQLTDSKSNVLQQISTSLIYNSVIQQIQLVPEKSVLVADGKTIPVIAVRFSNAQGIPAHSDLQGAFSITEPYQVRLHDQLRQQQLLIRDSVENTYRITEDGIAYIQLEPTNHSGEVNLDFTINQQPHKVSAWLKPSARDWIMVGIAEGSAAYNTIKQHQQNLSAPMATTSESTEDGRLAFYAKGQIQGKWLLTTAYDSDKTDKQALQRQMVDPTLYFTLYGDASKTQNDAPSSYRLYLKIERDQFYALYGDYTTGFTQTELGLYNRSFTGAKSAINIGNTAITAFAAEERSLYAKDELLGNGTSGPYRLTQPNILINSEKVRLEIKERNNELTIVNSQTLNRFIDYNIDYTTGQIVLKAPLLQSDANFNPQYLIVEYELNKPGTGELSSGLRVKYQTAKSQFGITAVNDSSNNENATLLAADAQVSLSDKQKVSLEIAQSDDGKNAAAQALLARYRYQTEHLNGLLELRVFDQNFGLGQQAPKADTIQQLNAFIRKQLSKSWQLEAKLLQQDTLNSVEEHQELSSTILYQQPSVGVNIGVRTINDTKDISAESINTDLITLGAYKLLWGDKIRLGVQSEFAVGQADNTQNAERYTGRIDYKVHEQATLYYVNEYSQLQDTGDAHQIGIKARPWKGAELNSSINSEASENGDRLYSNLGIVQHIPLTARLSVSAGVDVAEKLNEDNVFNSSQTTSEIENYRAVYGGISYKGDDWQLTKRAEFRNGDESKRYGYHFGWYRDLNAGLSYGSRLNIFDTHNFTINTLERTVNAELSAAYRPADSKWTILERLNAIDTRLATDLGETHTSKLINHLRINYKPQWRHQLSLGLSNKFNRQRLDESVFESFSHFVSNEYLYNLGLNQQRFAHLSGGYTAMALYQADDHSTKYAYGPTIGTSLGNHIWLSIGYNFGGFEDRDFAASSYTNEGVWFKFRLKFDQDTFNPK